MILAKRFPRRSNPKKGFHVGRMGAMSKKGFHVGRIEKKVSTSVEWEQFDRRGNLSANPQKGFHVGRMFYSTDVETFF
tara:strand:- start:19 stop:252 length:234 start_codon:yes stop_codon:yes gene_type:complete